MASGCTILGSATAPVQEVIDDEVQGLLAGFHDVEGLARQALRVLRDPESYRHLGAAARTRVLERFEQGQCFDRLVSLFEEVHRRKAFPREPAANA